MLLMLLMSRNAGSKPGKELSMLSQSCHLDLCRMKDVCHMRVRVLGRQRASPWLASLWGNINRSTCIVRLQFPTPNAIFHQLYQFLVCTNTCVSDAWCSHVRQEWRSCSLITWRFALWRSKPALQVNIILAVKMDLNLYRPISKLCKWVEDGTIIGRDILKTL